MAGLRPYAERLAGAPALIRAHVVDPAFTADCGPWLDATALWGQALVSTLDGLAARAGGDAATGQVRLAEAASLANQAGRSTPSRARPGPRVRCWWATGCSTRSSAGHQRSPDRSVIAWTPWTPPPSPSPVS